jgi:hypothetical protein
VTTTAETSAKAAALFGPVCDWYAWPGFLNRVGLTKFLARIGVRRRSEGCEEVAHWDVLITAGGRTESVGLCTQHRDAFLDGVVLCGCCGAVFDVIACLPLRSHR